MGLGSEGDDIKGLPENQLQWIILAAGILFVLSSFLIGYIVSPESSGGGEVLVEKYVCSDGSIKADAGECGEGFRKECPPCSQTEDEDAGGVGSATSTTQYPTTTLACINPPEPGCSCRRWSCPVTTTTSTTSTTCITVPYPDYEPEIKYFKIEIKEERFDPEEVEVFVNDTAIVIVENKKGLYKIRDPIENTTVLMKPKDVHFISFTAKNPGQHLLTCSQYCAGSMKSWINVVEPYRLECGKTR